jgi:glyoxylase-like metal-dependent hydrolase (beta-lactamase superfamily II)
MKITALNTAKFKLDGGAMFGVVPKVLWQKAYPADENNLCTWSMRCLLIETDDRKILIDCGIGDKQGERFMGNYHISEFKTFDNLLSEHSITTDQITDVILTHLHFDHCGGAVKHNAEKNGYELTFKNAVHWIGKQQWDLANTPNSREKASYLNENFIPIMESGKVKFIETDSELYTNISVRIYHGHTAGQVIPFINFSGKTLVYMADFIPTSAHIPLAWVISYDTQPLVSLAEKEKFLNEAVDKEFTLFFEHDVYYECCSVNRTEKGIRVHDRGKLKELFM